MNSRRILTFALAVLTVVLCAALCAAVLVQYHGGLRAREAAGSQLIPLFTPEAVGQKLLWIAPLFGCWLVLALIAGLTVGAPKSIKTPVQCTEHFIAVLRARLTQIPADADREASRRRRVMLAAGAVLAVCAGWSGIWLLDGRNFPAWQETPLETVMERLPVNLLPALCAAFTALLVAAELCHRSRRRETDILLAAVREQKPGRVSLPMESVEEDERLWLMRGALLVLAVALIIDGITNGGLHDVFVKATNICTECIGLG